MRCRLSVPEAAPHTQQLLLRPLIRQHRVPGTRTLAAAQPVINSAQSSASVESPGITRLQLVEPLCNLGLPRLPRSGIGRSVQARDQVALECRSLVLGELER